MTANDQNNQKPTTAGFARGGALKIAYGLKRKKKLAGGGSVRKAGETYDTPLDTLDEMAYRQWVKDNNVPTNPDAKGQQDYDMRGFWKGLQQQNPKAQSAVDPNDNRLHYPDYWKTPSHETFSNESQWAKPDSPSWTDDDKLVTPGGRVLYDDRAPKPLIAGFAGGGIADDDIGDSSGEVLPADGYDPFAAETYLPGKAIRSPFRSRRNRSDRSSPSSIPTPLTKTD